MRKRDLNQVKTVVVDAFKEVFPKAFAEAFAKIWDDFLEPNFTRLDKRIDDLDENLSGKIAALPTKAYIDEKFADRDQRLIEKLKRNNN